MHFDLKPEHNEILSYKQQYPKTIPGSTSYATRARNGKNVMVAGDSMVSGMSGKKLSEQITHGHAFIKPFLGATAEEMAEFYLQPILKRGKIDTAVLMIGTNNIPKKTIVKEDGSEGVIDQPPAEIVDDIIKVANECRAHGINDIFLNSIIYRRNKAFSDKTDQVNNILEQKCKENKFIFIDNSNLAEGYHGDNVHLTYDGKKVLSTNISECLNSFYDLH